MTFANATAPSNTSANISSETLDELNARFAEALLPLTITFGVFTFLGIGGNLLILLVFSVSREYKRNNFKIFVITLAIIDIITCMTLIPAEMIKQRSYFEFSDATSCKVKCFFNIFGACASCLTLFVISVDRYRKVVQPMRKQMSPKFAIYSLLFAAFVLPLVFAIPGTIMCGIQSTNKTNIYGSQTEIYLCSAADQYRYSIWRKVYKLVLTFVLAGMSLTYLILYGFVMREVVKQIRSMASQKKFSFDISLSSDIYDNNSIHPQSERRRSSDEHLVNHVDPVQNGSVNGKEPSKRKKASRQFSMRSLKSMRGKVPLIHRQQFPSKTIIWFILTVVFVTTYLAHNVLSLYVGEVLYMSPGRFAVFSFFFRIYFFNHMVNPLVYAIFIKRFRQSCRTLLPTLKKRISECFY